MKKILFNLFAVIICNCAFIQAQNVNQYITIYGHDFKSGYAGGVFSETRVIEIRNNSPYVINIGTIYAYNYSTGNVFFINNENSDLYGYSSMYVTIENNSESNKYFNNTWVISVNYMNYNDYVNYSKEIKTKKGSVSSGEEFEDLNPDNSFDNAIDLSGGPMRFNLNTIDDEDFFKVYAAFPDAITFKLKIDGECQDSRDRIFRYETFSNEKPIITLNSFIFNSNNKEQETQQILATQIGSNPYYIKIYFDKSRYSSEYYSDDSLTIQAFINDQPVSVEKVYKSEVSVYVQGGSIHVKGAKGEVVSVCSIDGKLVYNKVSDIDDVEIRLPFGIYIVKAGEVIKKVKL